jgi:protein-tyrosine phosphatase
MKVLFVCSGNICRSPMAAECFRQHAVHAGLSHVVVESAGTLGIVGEPASPEAIEAMAELGVDLRSHRSRALRAVDLKTSEIVIVMTRDHLDELAYRYRDGSDERLLLRAFEHGPRIDLDAADLEDPIGRELGFYREQALLIRRCVENLALFLKHRE